MKLIRCLSNVLKLGFRKKTQKTHHPVGSDVCPV